MDFVTSSREGDWAERKELEKKVRYGMHVIVYFIKELEKKVRYGMHVIVYFINHLSALHGRPWMCTGQLHGRSTGLPQADPIPRQAPPPRSYEL